MLKKNGITKFDDVIVSSEYRTGKQQDLFKELIKIIIDNEFGLNSAN